jgi:hypothetical protein
MEERDGRFWRLAVVLMLGGPFVSAVLRGVGDYTAKCVRK